MNTTVQMPSVERRSPVLAFMMLFFAAFYFLRAISAESVDWVRFLSSIGFLLLTPQAYFRPVMWTQPLSASMWRPSNPQKFQRILNATSICSMVALLASIALRFA